MPRWVLLVLVLAGCSRPGPTPASRPAAAPLPQPTVTAPHRAAMAEVVLCGDQLVAELEKTPVSEEKLKAESTRLNVLIAQVPAPTNRQEEENLGYARHIASTMKEHMETFGDQTPDESSPTYRQLINAEIKLIQLFTNHLRDW